MQLIPKVFHTIWVQGELPEEYRSWHESWLTFHPGWEHIVWSEPDFPDLHNAGIYETAVNHAQRAEIVSKEILWLHGGVFVDADFECLRNIEPLLEGVECFSAEETPGQISAGIVGATPKHPAVWALVEDITPSIERQREKRAPQTQGAGPHLLERQWRGRDDVTLFSPQQFYPYLWHEPRPAVFGDEAYAAHHWAATWKE